MSSQNDSVIICDTPSPSKLSSANVTNYRKRLRSSCNSKGLLDTVYESPLVHLRRNVFSRLHSEANAENDADSITTTPTSKRRKIDPKKIAKSNFDQSIVILNESIVEPAVEVGLSDVETTDVVEISKSSSSKKKSIKGLKKKLPTRLKTSSKSPRLKRRMERLLKKKTVEDENNINDENLYGQIMKDNTNATGDAEEIEVVWVSGPNTEPTSNNNPANEDQPFVIDKEPISANEQAFIVDNQPNPAYLTVKSAFRPRDIRIPKTNKAKGRNEKKSGVRKTRWDDNQGFNVNGPNVLPCNGQKEPRGNRLREIVIDGCNVAIGHKNGQGFSEKGLQIVIDYFKERGHVVRVFLPQSARTRDRGLIEKLHTEGYVVFTPSRKIGGREITPYDDRFILEYATKCNGIVVSSDQFRDMWREKPEWRDTIENRLLAPTFVGDYLMFPEDPLGRSGPGLEEFLRY